MRLDHNGVWQRRLFGAARFLPFDAMSSLEGGHLLLEHGESVPVPEAVRGELARVLAGPDVAATLAENALRLRAYAQGAWSAERACRALLQMAERCGATDVHLEAAPSGWELRVRLAGEVLPFTQLAPAAGDRLLAALKHLAGCLPYRKDLLQEGRIPRPGVAADVRASFVPTPLGERAALRLFGRLLALDALGLPAGVLAGYRSALGSASGLVLVAGASGAGKTTTLYASLAHLAAARRSAHLSIEDPVEQRLRHAGVPVDQVELCPERGLSGEAALAAALRQDVDVVAVGEVRTAAEAQLALRAAHTGRLVLAGVHAGTCDEARLRLVELGADAAVLGKTLRAVLHQHLRSAACPAHAPLACAACGGLGRVRVLEASLWSREADA